MTHSIRQQLRQNALALRDKLTLQQQQEGSREITEQLVTHPVFVNHRFFFIYCHFRSEVSTTALISHCLAQGKKVCVPLSIPRERRMEAVTITDPHLDLIPGYQGIPEPRRSVVDAADPTHRLVSPSNIEVAIVPGAAFDSAGHRLGYGKGYYDRFFAQAPHILRIGLAFFCQVVDRIPVQAHDIPMDIVITEQGLWFCSNGRRG